MTSPRKELSHGDLGLAPQVFSIAVLLVFLFKIMITLMLTDT